MPKWDPVPRGIDPSESFRPRSIDTIDNPTEPRMSHLPFTATSANRRGTVLVLAAVLLVLLFGFAAFSVDVSYIQVVRSELQQTADASALRLAKTIPTDFASARQSHRHSFRPDAPSAGRPLVHDLDIEIGQFDLHARRFTSTPILGNAVRVTAKAVNEPLFFAPIVGDRTFDLSRDAIAYLHPRDIVVVVETAARGSGLTKAEILLRDESIQAGLRVVLDELRRQQEGCPASGCDRVSLVSTREIGGERHAVVHVPMTGDIESARDAIDRLRPLRLPMVGGELHVGYEKARRILRTTKDGGQRRELAEPFIMVIGDSDAGTTIDSDSECRCVQVNVSDRLEPPNGLTNPASADARASWIRTLLLAIRAPRVELAK